MSGSSFPHQHILHPSAHPPTTIRLSFTDIFHPNITLYSGIGSTVHLYISPYCHPTPPVLAILFRAALDLLPSVPFAPSSPALLALFFRLFPCPLVPPPPFAALNVTSVPVGPSGLSLLRVHNSASIESVCSPPLPPLAFRPAHLLVPRIFASRVSGYIVLLTCMLPPLPPLCSPVSWCLLVSSDYWIIIIWCHFAPWIKARAHPLPDHCSSQLSTMRFSSMLATFSYWDYNPMSVFHLCIYINTTPSFFYEYAYIMHESKSSDKISQVSLYGEQKKPILMK